MATGSMMKDYVRRQLRYWAEDFKDEMLARDFLSKSFTKTQLLIPQIELKPHRVAAVLHLPSPLLVTSVHCVELTIAVPSWSDSDKEAAHRPVLIHMNELLVQVRNVWECSSDIRRAAEGRVQAALLEPDPLGSTAAMFAFARDVNDRTKVVVDKLRVQIFMGGFSRVEMGLADLHARTTDALWQDVKDPATCVDYSPDQLVQTRFKSVSFLLSVGINPPGSAVAGKNGEQMIPLVTKASVTIRVTRFYHRKELKDAWRRQMQLADVNLGAVKMEFSVGDFMEAYTVTSMLCNWFLNGRSSEKCSLFAPVDGMAADREPHRHEEQQTDQANIELQITFRGTLEAKLKFTSPTEGPQELFLIADRTAGSMIFHHHGVRELQMSLHELTVRFRGYVVFRLKPDREVFHLEQRHNSISVKWRVQSILCRVDDELAAMLTEIYEFVNEKEQAIVIRCGTCHQQISLDMIDVHVCPPRNNSKSLPSTPLAGRSGPIESRRSRFSKSSSAESGDSLNAEETESKSNRMHGSPKFHVVLHMDEFEVQTGSQIIHSMLTLLDTSTGSLSFDREMTTKLSNLHLTTESNEFAGDAIFVPALPLAFQMLECSLQGCGCLSRKEKNYANSVDAHGMIYGYRWPARLFLDVAHCCISSKECFVNVETVQVRSSFSEGSHVCSSSQPQLTFHVNMDKIRCQLDQVWFRLARQLIGHIQGLTTSEANSSSFMTLFLGVLQVRAIEFTLQGDVAPLDRAKSLLKQAIAVFDNQLGFLSIQSSLDFKTILNFPTMQFVHRQMPAVRSIRKSFFTLDQGGTDAVCTESITEAMTATEQQSGDTTSKSNGLIEQPSMNYDVDEFESADVMVPDKEITSFLTMPELEREDACRCIQRMVRLKRLVRQEKQHFQPDDYEPGVVKPILTSTPTIVITVSESGSNTSSPSPSPRKLSLGIPSPIMVLGGDNDLVEEIRGGISKLMSPLSRALPSDSIRGGINKLMGPINRTLSPTGSVKRKPSTELYVVTPMDARSPAGPMLSKTQAIRKEKLNDHETATTAHFADQANPQVTSSSKATQVDDDEDKSHQAVDKVVAEFHGLSEAKLAALPDLVRVLVQVGECRLCIPINPREKVKYLCQETVRHYNESFAADRGSILNVSLQDKHGGVVSPSDTVGFLLSMAPNELLFAYPHDGQVRSLARLTAGSLNTANSNSLTIGSAGDNAKLLRCSKIPLPLVIALLANESERDLIRSGLCERDDSVNGEAWPDLALNATSLDAEKNLITVEVVWHETCIEVTNGDAFALCRQLLGLCTSRAISKYVGKIIRSRLNVDSSTPLIEWAYRRKLAMEMESDDTNLTQAAQQEQEANVSYEQLKKVVQDNFGVYTR